MATGFGNGFVFTQQPNWDLLREIGPTYSIRGCQHPERPLWMAFIFDKAAERDGRRVGITNPDAIAAPTTVVTDASHLDNASRQALGNMEKIVQFLDKDQLRQGLGCIHLCLEVARRSEVPTFFFAADDEFVNLGCRATPGHWDECAAGFTDGMIRYQKGKLTLCVGKEPFSAAQLEKCRRLKGVQVRPPSKEENRKCRVFYGFPVELWPPDAGDPEEVFGFETLPFQSVNDDFKIVFKQKAK
jgi:hypothetical protein